MKIGTRKTIFGMLSKFDYLSQDDDEIEVTEWDNGEGWDVEIMGRYRHRFSISQGTLSALNYLTGKLEERDE